MCRLPNACCSVLPPKIFHRKRRTSSPVPAACSPPEPDHNANPRRRSRSVWQSLSRFGKERPFRASSRQKIADAGCPLHLVLQEKSYRTRSPAIRPEMADDEKRPLRDAFPKGPFVCCGGVSPVAAVRCATRFRDVALPADSLFCSVFYRRKVARNALRMLWVVQRLFNPSP